MRLGITLMVIAAILIVLFIARGEIIGNAVQLSSDANSNLSRLTLSVAIPCPGHAGLIVYELKKIDGVKNVDYNGDFIVTYDSSVTNPDKIISIDLFKKYTARRI